MVKAIVWSENALRQKIATYHYWTERNGSKTYARKLERQIAGSVGVLQLFPDLGVLLPGTSVRSFVIQKHFRLYYRLTDDILQILHFWDVRRDPDDLKLKNCGTSGN